MKATWRSSALKSSGLSGSGIVRLISARVMGSVSVGSWAIRVVVIVQVPVSWLVEVDSHGRLSHDQAVRVPNPARGVIPAAGFFR